MKSPEAIRARVKSTQNTQNKLFSKNRSSEIICNADVCVGEIRQFCRLQDEGDALRPQGVLKVRV
jgi:predicted ATPase with chaperone activity